MKRKMNRRQFLGTACAVGAGFALPQIVPASVLGQSAAAAPSNTVALGCIGVGGMGLDNMHKLMSLDNCRVLAVCDVYKDRQERAKSIVDEKAGNSDCAVYGDWRELIARDDIDAVMIAAQDHWHALMAVEAARAGKDIYCEKPLGVSVQESQAIRDAVRKHGRVFQTGTWQRSLENFQRACTLVRNGYIGRVHTVEVSVEGPRYQPKYKGPYGMQPVPEGFDWEMWRGPASPEPYNRGRVEWPDWYLIFDYCVGFITNWGVHHLDIAHWGCPRIGQEPFDLSCEEVIRTEGFTDNSLSWRAEFRYADDFKMIFTDEEKMKLGCKFIGEEGWVHVDRSGIWAEPDSLLTLPFKDSDERLTDSTHHGKNFLDCIASRKDPVSHVDAAHTASILGMLADIAGRTGETLRWDPALEQFINHDGANAQLKRAMHNGWSL